MIDLHIHTTNSDGKFNVKEMLEMAQERQLDYIAFTDHDSVGAYFELQNIDYKKIFSGKVLIGSEIRFFYNGIQMELLAYGFDFKKLAKSKYLQKKNMHTIKRALLDNCIQKSAMMGLKISPNLTYNPQEKSERTFYNDLIKYSQNDAFFKGNNIKHAGDLFRNFIANPSTPLYFDISKYSLSLKELSDLIHSCDGVALLAHPFGVYNDANPKQTVEEIAKSGLVDGLECMHQSVTLEQTEFLLDLCKKYNLLSSGGSDFHGFHDQVFAMANFNQTPIPTTLATNLISALKHTLD